ncbi:hypothetical protein [Lysinibacillus sp. Bpr_S20]|uniref:hypothetical protein n=1 Tax=Lysinibacillus sp. Bpr_S20 TaxID=2933964 RepID=UPI00201199AD|nr:hypothetical protein [Lysinibacillus sp. Bpr_S20]MCL1700757.1 hypothetical protein [Lysinibacillus sp. Bpr_S20]
MTYNEFCNKIANLGLSITIHNDSLWSVGYKRIANPMLYFNPLIEEENYDGNITVKSINVRMFNANELKKTLILIDELLLTKMVDRGEKVTFG